MANEETSVTIATLPLNKWECDNITFFTTHNSDGELCLLAFEQDKLSLFAFEIDNNVASCIYYSAFFVKEPIVDLSMSFEEIDKKYSSGDELPVVSLSLWLKIEARLLAHPLVDKVRPYFVVCGEV